MGTLRVLDKARSSSRKLLLDRGSGPRAYRKVRSRRAFLLLPFFLGLAALYLAQWFLALPPPHFNLQPTSTCLHAQEGYRVSDYYVCSHSCGMVCFPRVRGICVSHTEVTVCGDQPHLSTEIINAGGGLPDVLRLSTSVPRARVPVKRGSCPGWDFKSHKPLATPEKEGEKRQAQWIRGLQMVADVKLMPDGPNVGPNPHHEAEKLVPAIFLSQLYGLKNSTLHWFASRDPRTISRWSLGLIEVFRKTMKVEFLNVPRPDEPEVCFEDAILFSGLTNAGYIPGAGANTWLRKKVLGYCKIPATAAARPINNVMVLERMNSSRSIANMEEVLFTLERELMVVPKVVTSGIGDFCDQVKVIADADVVLTPHGSHNINFLFARPYATVLEAFPLLYYIDWFGNYVHAANIIHYDLYGTWLAEQGSMPFQMRMYANLYGWKHCFSTRGCMNYAKSQKVAIDIDQLEWVLKYLTSNCRVAVEKKCLTKAAQDSESWKIKDKPDLLLYGRKIPRWRKEHGWAVTQEILPERKGIAS